MNSSEGRARRVAHNTLFLYSAESVARLFSWAMLAYLTRRWLEVSTYGQYALIMNWVSIIAVFSELGLNVLVVREVAQQRDKALYYLRNAIGIRSFFSLVCWAGLIGISFGLDYESVIKVGMAVMGLRILLDSVAGGYVYLFQSHEMMGYYSLVNVVSSFVRLVGVVAVVEAGGGVVAACSIWVAASAVALVVLVLKGRQLGWRPDLSLFKLNEVFFILRQSLPLATFGALQMLYYRVNSIILKSLSGNEAVGYYDLAAKVLFVILTFSQIFGTAIFPTLSSVRSDRVAFGRMSGRALKFLLLIGVPATVGGALLAGPIVTFVSGDKYISSVPMFIVLMLSVAPFFLSHVYAIALATHNAFRLNLQYAVLLILNVGLNFVLISRMGTVGSAWSTVVCEFLGIGLGFGLAAPYLKYLNWVSMIRPFLACLGASAVMGAGIWFDPRLYWAILGPPVYALALWIFRGLNPEDWNIIISLFGRENPVRLRVDPDRPYVFKSTFKSKAVQLLDAIGNRFFASSSKPISWADMKKIAVLRLDHLGDVMLCLPAMEALARALPKAHIDFFVGPDSKDLTDISGLRINPIVFRAPWFDKDNPQKWSNKSLRELESLLRQGNYDAAIDLRGDVRHLIAMKRSGIRNRVAPARMGLGFTLTCRPRFTPGMHEMERNLDLLEQAGLTLPDKPRFPRLFPGRPNEKIQQDVVDGLGLSRPLIAIHATCPHPAKRWPAENWRRLIDGLPKEMDVVVVGSRSEKNDMEEILRGCERKIYQAPGLFSLPALAAFLRKCRIFIGVDSGPAHIAAAMGIPVVSLYSGTNSSRQWSPRGLQVSVFQKVTPCSPCELTDCPLNNECMRLIESNEVLAVIEKYLLPPH
jgi:ADP-heptose:LPS heptosyltransferase/O-antigen/teichoic acid export membrane protein